MEFPEALNPTCIYVNRFLLTVYFSSPSSAWRGIIIRLFPPPPRFPLPTSESVDTACNLPGQWLTPTSGGNYPALSVADWRSRSDTTRLTFTRREDEIPTCTRVMDLRILTLTTLCLGISYAAPMSMQNIKSKYTYMARKYIVHVNIVFSYDSPVFILA